METETLLPVLAVGLYLIGCFVVANVADKRGHNSTNAFFTSLFCSPLVAAIIYSPFKPIEQAQKEKAESIVVESEMLQQS